MTKQLLAIAILVFSTSIGCGVRPDVTSSSTKKVDSSRAENRWQRERFNESVDQMVQATPQPEPCTGWTDMARTELLNRFAKDRESRKAYHDWEQKIAVDNSTAGIKSKTITQRLTHVSMMAGQAKKDISNATWLEGIVSDYGWPKISDVGPDASKAAFILVQHATHDIGFQEQCLDLMKNLPKKEIDQSAIAYLTDRVLVQQGKDQIFGTQFKPDGSGGLKQLPIADPEHVDELRQEYGLAPMVDELR